MSISLSVVSSLALYLNRISQALIEFMEADLLLLNNRLFAGKSYQIYTSIFSPISCLGQSPSLILERITPVARKVQNWILFLPLLLLIREIGWRIVYFIKCLILRKTMSIFAGVINPSWASVLWNFILCTFLSEKS